MHIIDGFFSNFGRVRDLALTLPYKDEVYPADNVTYPGIAKELPEALDEATARKLRSAGFPHKQTVLSFFRLSVPSGTRAPHYVHTDVATAPMTLLVYMSDPPPGVRAGTAFYTHTETGMHLDPAGSIAGRAIWARDQRDLSLWNEDSFVEMRANRALIFDAREMHGALPTGGFGTNVHDGRLVYTMFFA